MDYLSIDLETTGLDPRRHQILEVGMVLVKDDLIVEEANFLYKYPEILGDPYALAMNSEILYALDADGEFRDGTILPVLEDDQFYLMVLQWWERYGKRNFTLAGKNVGSFDRQFLVNTGMPFANLLNHRCIDIGNLWLRPEDKSPPNLQMCCERAGVGIDASRCHRALYDAMLVHDCIQAWRESNGYS